MIHPLNRILFSVLIVGWTVISALAQGQPAQTPPGPANKGQQPQQNPGPGYTAEEAAAFNAFVTAPTQDEKIKLAEQFLAMYPNSKLAPDASKALVGFYIQKGDLDKAFAHGTEHLTKYPGEFGVIYALAETASRAAKSGNHKYDDQGMKYAQEVLSRIEKNEAPAGVQPETWNAQKNAVSAAMHQSIGLFLKSKNDPIAAAEHLRKSAQLDPSDPVTFYLLGESLKMGEYAQIQQKYGALPDKTTDEAKALLGKADQVVDQMIEAYAQTIAVSGNKPEYAGLVSATKPTLEEFYKYRHNKSLDGLQEIIDKFKPGASPSAPAKPQS